eukprot:Colp12_sorted_trinity150504_noHs@34804
MLRVGVARSGVRAVLARSSIVAVRSLRPSVLAAAPLMQKAVASAVRPIVVGSSIRSFATSHDEWAEKFKAATVDLAKMDVNTISYQESAERLRTLLKSGLLLHNDLHDNPERFFLAHRLLARHAPVLGPGFWIRFTVHYNLCVGTVLGLGNKEQVESLKDMQSKGLLGCFSLTEKLAGVNSGLVVNTTATYDPATEQFIINTPNEGARKNWISQGLVADKTVVVADLLLSGKSYGPHAFFIDLRRNGEVVPGVEHGDMGKKTVGNDLDNAWIAFHNVAVPKNTLLSRYADIENGQYVQKVKGLPVFHMIGQRLFSGRVAVAQAALQFRRGLFERTKAYTDNKKCWGPVEQPVLSSIPQLRALFINAEERISYIEKFVNKCEADLCEVLRKNTVPSIKLVEAIAVCKVKAVEESIELTHRLRNDVGSYALMSGTGFEQTDFLVCCKFAEGDSRILMQKMARDRLREYSQGKAANQTPKEIALCKEISEAMEVEIKKTGN